MATDRFEQFVASVESAYKSIQKIKRQEMDEFGLRGAHVMCLYFLGSHPEGLTSVQLSAACGEDKAAISRSVSELEGRGLITFGSETGKKRYRAPAFLTDEGKKVSRRMDDIISGVVRQADRGLADEEREVFYRAFGKIAANLQRYLAEKEAPSA